MNVNAAKEYKDFIEKYLLRLLGISSNNIQSYSGDFKGAYIVQRDGYIYFSTNTETVFALEHNRKLSEDNISAVKNIIISFFAVAKYRTYQSGTAHRYYSDTQKVSNYELAIQKGICTWIIGKANEDVEELLGILEKWSVQTYEGKKVTMGFVINPSLRSNFDPEYGKFKSFIKDDFFAVFTDCIDSVIEVDEHCEFCRYLSVTENNKIENYSLSKHLPIRFANVIQRYVTGNRVGIFLLNNGDIILSKNQEIRFVKRNLKWLNMSYESFYNALADFADANGIEESLIEDIYASTLDVSFSHGGGIISVVENVSSLTNEEKDGFPILHQCDYLLNRWEYNKLFEYFKEQNERYEDSGNKHLTVDEKEIRKRILKRNALDSFIMQKPFGELDRKLRCELISLDGACILNAKGDICACGAIIKNDSGSSGGGRGAASKKLSRFGMAIKVSTDGYIELYLNGSPKYSIK